MCECFHSNDAENHDVTFLPLKYCLHIKHKSLMLYLKQCCEQTCMCCAVFLGSK